MIKQYVPIDDLGHWEWSGHKFHPADYFGFVYCIENKKDKTFYIGKKQFYHHGKKKSRTYGKEMNWRNYVGSSKHLKEDIKKHGKKHFKFDMIDLYSSRGGLYYAEAYLQMLTGCMIDYKKIGKPEARFYNRQIAAIRFRPTEFPSKKTIAYVNKLKKRY